MIIDKVKTNFDDDFNEMILNELIERPYWKLQFYDLDRNRNKTNAPNESEGIHSDFGLTMQSWMENGDSDGLAEIIATNVMKKSSFRFEEHRFVRFFWNYYNRSSFCQTHTDKYNLETRDNEKFFSIVYFVNTSDAETVFELDDQEVRVENSMGEAVIFDSDILHYATSPKQSPFKVSLNIQFGCLDYFPKEG